MAQIRRYEWSASKNALLRKERGVGFEDMLEAIAGGNLLDVLEHPNRRRYGAQQLFVVGWRGYVYLVPFVESDEKIFLKTIIPSRKMNKQYGGRK